MHPQIAGPSRRKSDETIWANYNPHMLHGAGIFTYIWAIFGVNIGTYSIHGAYGIWLVVQ